MSGGELESAIEAILFASSEPVSRERLLEVFEEKRRPDAALAIDAVVDRYAESRERGFMVDEVAGGLRLVTRPDLHGYLRRFFEITGQTKLSMAALETLAIIAYRQPVTGPEIQDLRGVSSSGVLKTLLERRLVRIAGRKEVVGKPFLYASTREFLMHFGLRSLKELPPLEEFEELYASEAGDELTGRDHEEEVLKEAAEVEEREDDRASRGEAEATAESAAEAETEWEPTPEDAGEVDTSEDEAAAVREQTRDHEASEDAILAEEAIHGDDVAGEEE